MDGNGEEQLPTVSNQVSNQAGVVTATVFLNLYFLFLISVYNWHTNLLQPTTPRLLSTHLSNKQRYEKLGRKNQEKCISDPNLHDLTAEEDIFHGGG